MIPSQRTHIGIFGKTNVGKSSFFNFLTGQNIAIVSNQAGTTTDPIKKNFELGQIGAVTIIDTAGLNDNSILGKARSNATLNVIKQIDVALLLFEENSLSSYELELIGEFGKHKIGFLLLHTKSDILPLAQTDREKIYNQIVSLQNYTESNNPIPILEFSINGNLNQTQFHSTLIKELEKILAKKGDCQVGLLDSLVPPRSRLLLITPIDASAPKGRLILPQVQIIRAALDLHCRVSIIQPQELELYLQENKNNLPHLVITDSQAFKEVSQILPDSILLTGFSMVLARESGPFNLYIEGAKRIKNLKSKDRVLILESCNHTITCEDIGRVKIPTLLNKFTNSDLEFTFVSNLEAIPADIENYKLVVQCGGCMVTKKQIENRLMPAINANVPVTNYGMSLAVCMGIFDRAIRPFEEIK